LEKIVAAYDSISIWSKNRRVYKSYYQNANDRVIATEVEYLEKAGLANTARKLRNMSMSELGAVSITEESKSSDSKIVTTVIISRKHFLTRKLMIASATALTAILTAASFSRHDSCL
jgi:hypothetical protein